MQAATFIKIEEFCINFGIEKSFVFDLQEYEIIQVKLINEEPHITEEELPVLEKMIRLHQELEINPQGLQAIYHLLEKVSELQEKVVLLQRKLNRFKD